METPSVGIPILDHFLALLADHGYSITFGFAVVENLFLIGSVVPGETVQVAAGFVSSYGGIDPFLVWAVAFAGSFLGGNISYIAGRHGGRPWLERTMGRFHIGEKRLAAAEAYFAKHGSETVFLARWVAGVKNFAPALAGVSRMPVFWFELYSFLGALVYTSLLVAGGYFFGEYLEVVVDVVKGSAWAALVLVALAIAYVRFRVWRHDRRKMLEKGATGEFSAVATSSADPEAPEAEGEA